MAKQIKTEISINASPEKIWKILTHFEAYPSWNPFIKSIEGEIKMGNAITVKIAPPDANEMTFKPTVLEYETNKKLSWLGHLLVKGLFDSEHKFELHDNHNGTTTFVHSENFSGLLVPIFKKQLEHNTKNGFMLMNEKLKELAEK
jgi:hypothetical protein